MSTFDRDRESKDESTADAAAPATIYRDAKPGGSTATEAATAPVDAALAQRGSGAPHESGATFHDDATSHAAADALGANAFTAGNDVYFGAGQLAPGTGGGDALIQHELAHVDQGQGVAPPEPGNFRVSSPSDSAEVAARDGSGGGEAAAQTIHRDDHGGPAPAVGGAGPVAGAPHAGGGDAGASPAPDPYEAFKAAINHRDRGDANAKWSSLSGEQKAKVGAESDDFQRHIVYVMHKDAPKMLKAGNVHLTPSIVYTIFFDAEFDQWLPEMRTSGLLTPFLIADPLKGMASTNVAKQLTKWASIAANITEAKSIFHKVYPTLLDTATLSSQDVANGISVVAWSAVAQVGHLMQTLAEFLPTGHVQTIQGFFLMNTTSGKVWGWWQPWNYLVALPLHSGAGSRDKDLKEHGGSDMTGGSGSGAASPTGGNTYTAPGGAPGAGANAAMGHFEGTVLHEVGHGVGARLGGDKYALASGNWPGFTAIGGSAWANDMWEAPTGTGDKSVSKNAQKIDDAHARAFMLAELTAGKEGVYSYDPGWFKDKPSHDDVSKWLKTRYANVPLQKWWKHIIHDKATLDDSYAWDDPVRHKGGWVYGILTRADPSPGRYMKFKEDTWKNKVSWYSISSPLEWFAEQYAHYYRTEKTGGGLIDTATKDLLDKLDKTAWDPTTADGSKGIVYHTPGSAQGGGGGQGVAQQSSQATSAGASPRPQVQQKEPLFFPW